MSEYTPFKMKGFSGFGNSPFRAIEKKTKFKDKIKSIPKAIGGFLEGSKHSMVRSIEDMSYEYKKAKQKRRSKY